MAGSSIKCFDFRVFSRRALWLLSLLLCFPATSLGQAVFSIDDFEELTVSGSLNAEVVRGSESKIEIYGYDQSGLEWDSFSNRFSIRRNSSGSSVAGGDFRVLIHHRDPLEKISASLAAQVTVNSVVNTEELELKVTTAAVLNIAVYTAQLEVKVTSGSELNISGSADRLELKVNSGALVSGNRLRVNTAEVVATSGGEVRLEVLRALNAKASSGGEIRYRGKPRILSEKVSSGGEIEQSGSTYWRH